MKNYKRIKWTKVQYLIDKPNRAEDEFADVYEFDDEYFHIDLVPTCSIHGLVSPDGKTYYPGNPETYVFHFRCKWKAICGYGSRKPMTLRQAKIAAHKFLIEEAGKLYFSLNGANMFSDRQNKRSPGGKVGGKNRSQT